METPTGGTVSFDGDPVSELSGESLREFRRRAQLIVQDPNDAFNPRTTVGEAVAEPLVVHGMDDADRRERIVTDLFERVGLSAADADRYPHEFSGGEKQRLAIARALTVDPDLIVADEPTSALDARVRSDVLGLLADIRDRFGVSILLVSHDIDTVRRFCDRIAVMYLGEVVEKGRAEGVLSAPEHPYTRVLLDSVPDLTPGEQTFARPLTDSVPDPSDPPDGCRFHTRCPAVIAPVDADLSRETWRRLAAFRFAVETGDLPGVVEDPDERVDAERVRAVFDLPDRIPDEAADSAVSDAVAALARGEVDGARQSLADALGTVCEREAPSDTSVDGRTVRCHRHDPAVETDPLE
jgi:peptide/nickel transport system ATP-binding protein